jgi:hypothetical protein
MYYSDRNFYFFILIACSDHVELNKQTINKKPAYICFNSRNNTLQNKDNIYQAYFDLETTHEAQFYQIKCDQTHYKQLNINTIIGTSIELSKASFVPLQ